MYGLDPKYKQSLAIAHSVLLHQKHEKKFYESKKNHIY